MKHLLLCLLLAASVLIELPSAIAAETTCAPSLVVCGWDEVFILDLAQAEKGTIKKTWSWRATDREELPAKLRPTFRTTDDCKPIAGGNRILITSSSGGCALVQRPSGHVLWHASAPNAHSIELLPQNRVVVASSVSPQGNRLILFDLGQSDRILWETPLVSAHGVVWDEKRQCLWALGLAELRRYEPRDWSSAKPSLVLEATHALPDEGGHDLQAIPGTNDLVVTSGKQVNLFDRDQARFRLHPQFGNQPHVKCVSTDPVSGRIAWLQAQSPNWWTDTIGLLAPPGKVIMTGERLYKARWLPR